MSFKQINFTIVCLYDTYVQAAQYVKNKKADSCTCSWLLKLPDTARL
jgi:hypothetical protein